MPVHQFRCGTSAAVFSPAPAAASRSEDRHRVRLVARLHMDAPRPAPAGFRVIGVNAEGREALICLAATRAEAEARLLAHTGQHACVLLQRWLGTACAGRWEAVVVRGRRHRRQLTVRNGLRKWAE